MTYVVGVDGCPGGWISASSDGEEFKFRFHPTLGGLVAEHEASELVAVDIPIGLAEGEARRCDVEARKLLGERRSSVFPAPDRRVVEAFVRDALSHSELNALSKSFTGKGLSAQTYNIVSKISEADELITPESQARIVEVHPELSFLALAGRPMNHPKKTSDGFRERRDLLFEHFSELEITNSRDALKLCPPARSDDVLDAIAAATSASRLMRGEADRIPYSTQLDRRGLRMEMVF